MSQCHSHRVFFLRQHHVARLATHDFLQMFMTEGDRSTSLVSPIIILGGGVSSLPLDVAVLDHKRSAPDWCVEGIINDLLLLLIRRDSHTSGALVAAFSKVTFLLFDTRIFFFCQSLLNPCHKRSYCHLWCGFTP